MRNRQGGRHDQASPTRDNPFFRWLMSRGLMGAEQHELKTLQAHYAVSEHVNFVDILGVLTLDQNEMESHALSQLFDLLKHRKKLAVSH